MTDYQPLNSAEEVRALAGKWREEVRTIYGQGPTGYATLKCASELEAALSLPAAQDGDWLSRATMPKEGSFLVTNAKGQVAPWINGVIHNAVGTAHDWEFGEAITAWRPHPTAPTPNAIRGDKGAEQRYAELAQKWRRRVEARAENINIGPVEAAAIKQCATELEAMNSVGRPHD